MMTKNGTREAAYNVPRGVLQGYERKGNQRLPQARRQYVAANNVQLLCARHFGTVEFSF